LEPTTNPKASAKPTAGMFGQSLTERLTLDAIMPFVRTVKHDGLVVNDDSYRMIAGKSYQKTFGDWYLLAADRKAWVLKHVKAVLESPRAVQAGIVKVPNGPQPRFYRKADAAAEAGGNVGDATESPSDDGGGVNADDAPKTNEGVQADARKLPPLSAEEDALALTPAAKQALRRLKAGDSLTLDAPDNDEAYGEAWYGRWNGCGGGWKAGGFVQPATFEQLKESGLIAQGEGGIFRYAQRN
jgi:hypothetical protein